MRLFVNNIVLERHEPPPLVYLPTRVLSDQHSLCARNVFEKVPLIFFYKYYCTFTGSVVSVSDPVLGLFAQSKYDFFMWNEDKILVVFWVKNIIYFFFKTGVNYSGL